MTGVKEARKMEAKVAEKLGLGRGSFVDAQGRGHILVLKRVDGSWLESVTADEAEILREAGFEFTDVGAWGVKVVVD